MWNGISAQIFRKITYDYMRAQGANQACGISNYFFPTSKNELIIKYFLDCI